MTGLTPLTLADAQHGCDVRIVKIRGAGAIRQRMLDMGITRGVVVRVQRLAPLGDPIQICLKGYCLALRRKEALEIVVEALEPREAESSSGS